MRSELVHLISTLYSDTETDVSYGYGYWVSTANDIRCDRRAGPDREQVELPRQCSSLFTSCKAEVVRRLSLAYGAMKSLSKVNELRFELFAH